MISSSLRASQAGPVGLVGQIATRCRRRVGLTAGGAAAAAVGQVTGVSAQPVNGSLGSSAL
jgi:hypothetical protein